MRCCEEAGGGRERGAVKEWEGVRRNNVVREEES